MRRLVGNLTFRVLVAIALGVMLVVVNLVKPGARLDVSSLAGGDVSRYTTQAEQMTFVDFVMHIVPPQHARRVRQRRDAAG